MKITATPLTAAAAGVVTAIAWPFIWSRYGGTSSAGSVELVIATLLVIALPAHAFVVGFGYTQASGAGSFDVALLKRIGAWLAAAAAVTLARLLFRG